MRNFGNIAYCLSIVVLLLHVTIARAETGENAVDIVGGSSASAGEFPYLVSIMVKRSGDLPRHICGGTIADANYVITAAHCVQYFDPAALQVVAGAHFLWSNEASQQKRNVNRIIKHSQYNSTNHMNDIALLQITPPFEFEGNTRVGRAIFPVPNQTSEGSCHIAGWGMTRDDEYSDVLLKASVPIVSKAQCQIVYGGAFDYPTQICAGYPQGGVDACAGDTGGPLMCTFNTVTYFAGIVSWGHLCALPGYPGVYQEISKYISWIQNPN